MFLLGEGSTPISGIHVKDNQSTAAKDGKEVEEKEEKIEDEKEEEKSFTIKHNEDAFSIDFQFVDKYENIQAKRRDEEKVAGKDMDVSKDEEESIETIFQQWSQEEMKFYYQ